ncbi:protein of unknown function [Denitratisoma oestradiolicum]|uniref:Uncharacterized protein n=1 Tax=Denitratisoma oestradiolicum TaxID=311182 RepID=A0A6S6Y076_9PROT|nr:protein of unknown function [Denitratisoma oestradiolicum]
MTLVILTKALSTRTPQTGEICVDIAKMVTQLTSRNDIKSECIYLILSLRSTVKGAHDSQGTGIACRKSVYSG